MSQLSFIRIFGASGTGEPQESVKSVGKFKKTGATVSTTVILCDIIETLLQPSVAVNVL